MENSMLYYSLLSFSILYLTVKLLLNARKKGQNLPPSPPALPIIGHLHLLRQPLNRTFDHLAQKYGPIFSLKLGPRLVVVVSSPSAVEECFTKNDIIFANRPLFPSARHLTYNYTNMASAPYGDHWRNLRRIGSVEIFSSSRLSAFADIRKDEVRNLLHRLYGVSQHGFAKVKLRQMFRDLTFNVIMRMVAGKRYYGEDVNGTEEARQFRETLEEFLKYGEATNPADMLPILRFFDFGGFEKRCVSVCRRLDLLLEGLIDEHRADKGRNTMINRLLALQDLHPEYYTDQTIKGLVQILLLGGTETVTTSLEWGMSNLLNHPDVLRKAKSELDIQVGQSRLIDESDFPKLEYLQNIVSENSRLYTVTPFLIPHSSSSECTVAGYRVPEGTILFANAWSIHRDPKIWDDPTEFRPERFEGITAEGHKFMPFGLGRRACPGEALANKELTLTLGALIQCFEWKTIDERKIDMTEKTLVTMTKAEPLELMCKPYSNAHKIFC